MTWQILPGDCIESMKQIPTGWAQTVVSSPPYWALRDYEMEGQIGAESSPWLYVEAMRTVFREVYRLLRDDGTLWLNLGDSYHGGGSTTANGQNTRLYEAKSTLQSRHSDGACARPVKPRGYDRYRPKDLIGIPWLVAFALQADGWYLRRDIVWHKPNTMPSSATDRPITAHEYLFLLTKSPDYLFNHKAIQEEGDEGPRNSRSVWTIPTCPSRSGIHSATMPPTMAERCILAGSNPDDLVFDPFTGEGTTAVQAFLHGRRFLGCELNPAYIVEATKLIQESTRQGRLW
jgi:site-specific DNA-methyltransferase (adenine-specific)